MPSYYVQNSYSPSATKGDCYQTAVAIAKATYCFELAELLKVLHVYLVINQASCKQPYSTTIDFGFEVAYCSVSCYLTYSYLTKVLMLKYNKYKKF